MRRPCPNSWMNDSVNERPIMQLEPAAFETETTRSELLFLQRPCRSQSYQKSLHYNRLPVIEFLLLQTIQDNIIAMVYAPGGVTILALDVDALPIHK